MLARVLALAALPLLLAAAPGPVLQADGLGKVRVGMTIAAAERALGARLRMFYVDPDNRRCGEARRRDGDRGISYLVEDGRITRVDVFSRAVRTAKGVGLGTPAAAVRRAYGRAIVDKPHTYSDGRYYEVHMPGTKTGFVFEINEGKVTALRSGRFPSVAYVEGCL